jgi:hypothetical protein
VPPLESPELDEKRGSFTDEILLSSRYLRVDPQTLVPK